jgi:hypothetical protein
MLSMLTKRQFSCSSEELSCCATAVPPLAAAPLALTASQHDGIASAIPAVKLLMALGSQRLPAASLAATELACI